MSNTAMMITQARAASGTYLNRGVRNASANSTKVAGSKNQYRHHMWCVNIDSECACVCMHVRMCVCVVCEDKLKY